MSRRMTAPGIWTLEPPAVAHRTSRAFASVPAEVVGSMRPILTPGGIYTAAERAPHTRQHEARKAARAAHTPPGYRTLVMTGARTNLDNGAVKAPITEVQR